MGRQAHSFKELDKFRNQLKKNGLKATEQRVAVHEAMMDLGHASADMVCEWLDENSSANVTKTSVYNILNQMALLGIYDYRMSANNKMYFDVVTAPHFHMYDCANHCFKDIMDEELHSRLLAAIGTKRFRGYKIENIDIQFVVRPTKKATSQPRKQTEEGRKHR